MSYEGLTDPIAVEDEYGNATVRFDNGKQIECESMIEAEALVEAWRRWPNGGHRPVDESRGQWRTGFADGAAWQAARDWDTAMSTTTIVCICGSTRFPNEIAAARAYLTLSGEIVVGPEVLVRSDPAYVDLHDSDQKVMLDELHFRKIDLAQYVYVVNPGGYVGDSTRREIEYALGRGKPVQYLEAPSDVEIERGRR